MDAYNVTHSPNHHTEMRGVPILYYVYHTRNLPHLTTEYQPHRSDHNSRNTGTHHGNLVGWSFRTPNFHTDLMDRSLLLSNPSIFRPRLPGIVATSVPTTSR